MRIMRNTRSRIAIDILMLLLAGIGMVTSANAQGVAEPDILVSAGGRVTMHSRVQSIEVRLANQSQWNQFALEAMGRLDAKVSRMADSLAQEKQFHSALPDWHSEASAIRLELGQLRKALLSTAQRPRSYAELVSTLPRQSSSKDNQWLSERGDELSMELDGDQITITPFLASNRKPAAVVLKSNGKDTWSAYVTRFPLQGLSPELVPRELELKKQSDHQATLTLCFLDTRLNVPIEVRTQTVRLVKR